jgi:uncharacterized protein YjiS (DUF1127 family)
MITKYGQSAVPRSIPASRAQRSLALKALCLPLLIYRCWVDETKIRQATRDLEQLDDHTLKDIGLQRGSIESHVRSGRRKQR